MKRSIAEIMGTARDAGTVVPAFNVPYLPMMAPVVQAVRDSRAFGLIMVARLEWVKFEAKSLRAIRDEYERAKDERFTRLHLDHVPAIDEDNLVVDYMSTLEQAVRMGYDSIMFDGSRLPLAENIAATRCVVGMAHAAGVPVEAELGAVFGHEAGPMPPYEELFASGKGFTDPSEARRFVDETRVDWLSVAVGSVRGAISAARRTQKKLAARINIEHFEKLRQATGVPLVLHGGTGIPRQYVLDAVRHGIAKINVATAIRQPYEALRGSSQGKAEAAVYDTVRQIVREELAIENSVDLLDP